eukprot:2934939-Rhodomonas_salina.1
MSVESTPRFNTRRIVLVLGVLSQPTRWEEDVFPTRVSGLVLQNSLPNGALVHKRQKVQYKKSAIRAIVLQSSFALLRFFELGTWRCALEYTASVPVGIPTVAQIAP